MPSLSLFLPALLGGFIYVQTFYRTRLWTQRREGYSLVLAASVAGGVLWFVSHLVWSVIGDKSYIAWFVDWWEDLVPVQHSLGTATAFVLGCVLPPAFNLAQRVPRWSTEKLHRRFLESRADPLEILLNRALEERTAVAVTLRSNKVYVGSVTACTKPSYAIESISLSLLRSGYRDKDTHALYLVVDYDDARHRERRGEIEREYERLIDKAIAHAVRRGESKDAEEFLDRVFLAVFGKLDIAYEDLPFTVVLPVREIQSISPFDLEFFDKHFSSAKSDKPDGGEEDAASA